MVGLVFSKSGFAAPVVRIDGGADAGGQNYSWTVEHDHSSPLVHLSVPHYRADLLIPPKGWHGTIEHPSGWFTRAGRCVAEADNATTGIPRSMAATFGLRVPVKGVARGSGQFTLRFADGTELSVTAEVPVREPLGEQYTPLLALSCMFVGLVLVRALKARRRQSTA
jgi:hypothetical protein